MTGRSLDRVDLGCTSDGKVIKVKEVFGCLVSCKGKLGMPKIPVSCLGQNLGVDDYVLSLI